MNYQKLIPILNTAGIHVSREAEQLLGVTRQTIYSWDKGIPPKMKRVRQQVDYFMRRVVKATELGLLPIDTELQGFSDRIKTIKTALKKADEEMSQT